MARKRCVTVYLKPEQASELGRLSAETRVPQANYIREGIDAVLERYEGKVREQRAREIFAKHAAGAARRKEGPDGTDAA